MTEQERQLITDLADRIKNAPAPQIDRDAYDLILHTIGTRPDALYILTQTVLLQQMALEQAKAQQPQPGFLPGGGYQGSGYQGSGYAAPASSGGGFSSFLHNVATTAAGVIAGDLAFDALTSLFGGGRGYYGGGSFLGGGGGETIVNNYYGDDRGGSDDSRFAQFAGQDQNISPDIDDERDNSGDAFDDSSYEDGSSFDDGGGN